MPKNNSTCCANAQPCKVAAPELASTPEYTLAIEQEVQQGFRKTSRTKKGGSSKGSTISHFGQFLLHFGRKKSTVSTNENTSVASQSRKDASIPIRLVLPKKVEVQGKPAECVEVTLTLNQKPIREEKRPEPESRSSEPRPPITRADILEMRRRFFEKAPTPPPKPARANPSPRPICKTQPEKPSRVPVSSTAGFVTGKSPSPRGKRETRVVENRSPVPKPVAKGNIYPATVTVAVEKVEVNLPAIPPSRIPIRQNSSLPLYNPKGTFRPPTAPTALPRPRPLYETLLYKPLHKVETQPGANKKPSSAGVKGGRLTQPRFQLSPKQKRERMREEKKDPVKKEEEKEEIHDDHSDTYLIDDEISDQPALLLGGDDDSLLGCSLAESVSELKLSPEAKKDSPERKGESPPEGKGVSSLCQDDLLDEIRTLKTQLCVLRDLLKEQEERERRKDEWIRSVLVGKKGELCRESV